MVKLVAPFIKGVLPFLVCTLSSLSAAETPSGKIDVLVKDKSGAVVPGAKVEATGDKGQFGKCTTTSDGACPILELPVGSYKLVVTHQAYKTAVMTGLAVELHQTTQANFVLEVGRISETVDVTAEVPLLQVDTTEVGTVLQSQMINNLPINGRSFIDFALLAPGVTIGDGSVQSKAPGNAPAGNSLALNGSRPRSSSVVLDGMSVDNPYSNSDSAKAPDLIPATALDGQATVLTSSGPEFGRNSGTTFNFATKAGTNHFHGELAYHLLNDALNSRDFFNFLGRKNSLRYNNISGAIGGPLRRDKITWFVSYEGQHDSLRTSTLVSVPAASDIETAIASLGGNPTVPLAQNPVVNPVIRNLLSICQSTARCPGGLSLWPSPSPQLVGQVLNAVSQPASHGRFDKAFLRLDISPTESNSIYTYYAFSDSTQSSPLTLGGGDPLPQTNTRQRLHTHLLPIAYARTLSSRAFNTIRFVWSRYSAVSLDDDNMNIGNPDSTIGLNTAISSQQDFGLPQLRVRGFAFLGSSAYANPGGRIENNWQAEDQLVWSIGNNTLKTGYLFIRDDIASFNDVNHRGLLEFSSLQDFLAGNVLGGSISKGHSDRSTTRNSNAAYIQDNYRWHRLGIDFGMRWDYFGVLHEDRNLFSKYDPSVGLLNLHSVYAGDFGNFSPRVGISWTLTSDSKNIVHASAGRFFDPIAPQLLIGQVQFNTFNPGIAYNALPQAPILTSRSPVALLQIGVPVFPVASFISDTRDAFTVGKIRTPYVINYTIDFQREIFPDAVFQIAYIASQGRKLVRVRDINSPAIPGGVRPFAAAALLSAVAPNSPFVVNQIETSATSNFNSLQLTLRQNKGWHKWQNYAFWTWSHSIDDASDGIDFVPNASLPNNSRFPARERASSNFDQRHTILWQSTYEFPSPHNSGWLKEWHIAGVLTVRSGQPYTINLSDEFDNQGSYDFILRPDIVGNPFFGTSTPFRLLNLAAFQVPCTLDGLGTTVSHCLPRTLHFGNLSRNAFVGPGFGKLDLGLSKTLTLTEYFHMQVRADAFNVTNHPIFANPLLPRSIVLGSSKGIGPNGRLGGAGVDCNTASASVDCYLTGAATPDGASNGPPRGLGSRVIQFAATLSF
jgi:hypothetical protein